MISCKSRALSTVLTTVIILVASVVLASGVVLYGASLFQGGTQTEAISVSDVKIWVHATDANGLAWGAAGVRNTGDKVVSVDKIQIRGIDIPFGQWYPDVTVTPTLFQQALNHTGWSGVTGSLTNNVACNPVTILELSGGSATDDICADVATGPVSLTPGQSAIIYFKLTNGTLSPLDSGNNAGVSIFAGKTGSPRSVTIQGQS
ncbi:hypothetical protein [Nitrosarchaeum sp.]|uniref:hypothetical protein n=1 Tax=Nitrosarchaeum sp. TaxID=2026886 RepID=UPI00247F1124|nr:hypothetical protein [Nitrosarchaeum sp.]MCV0411580.1 hypothetical protein [Nitrosarchaeum sp.]